MMAWPGFRSSSTSAALLRFKRAMHSNVDFVFSICKRISSFENCHPAQAVTKDALIVACSTVADCHFLVYSSGSQPGAV